MVNQKNVLIIFMKAPHLGKVKTRLQPHFTKEDSVILFRAMCEDLVNKFIRQDEFDLEIHFAPAHAQLEMQNWLSKANTFVPQCDGNLGDKMNHAFATTFEKQYEKTVIIGSDLPSLTVVNICAAFDALAKNDVVFGPTDDGGYYLIGQKKVNPALFSNVEWSTENVLQKNLENAKMLNLSATQIQQKQDLDTIVEVTTLWENILANSEIIQQQGLFHTEKALRSILKK